MISKCQRNIMADHGDRNLDLRPPSLQNEKQRLSTYVNYIIDKKTKCNLTSEVTCEPMFSPRMDLNTNHLSLKIQFISS